ncbi:DUF4212 domain-containing protein [Trichlorobacter ammonificans]|uniref:Sodium symporter small subunit domain-containing protein n=1 Tax=Trichlorobacter ammonificans TaxID=2916410 RepID=A0ABM9D8G7_9BACT|nr:DUF4212 domain-containing protein [Trichlorobacter ammonificans]CAH2031006.1 conserved protein of unknown function [Trichlorobacter ammonificans]
MNDQDSSRSVNLFRPLKGVMAREVRLIAILLTPCLLAVFVSQFGILLLAKSAWGSLLNEFIVFNLPIPYWLTGQFLPLWFILVGVGFNLWVDRNEDRHMEAIRYRARGRRREEMN